MANGLQNKGSGIPVSFDDIPSAPKRFENFRMHNRGEKARASLVFENKEEMLLGARVHYDSRLGGFFACTEGVCCHLGKSHWRVSAPILIYSGDRKRGELYRWTFGQLTYTQLKKLHEVFPLWEHDFGLMCEHPDYQRYSIVPANKCLWRSWDYSDDIMAEAKEIRDSTIIAKDISNEEIERVLGDTAPPVSAPVQNSARVKSFTPERLKNPKERPEPESPEPVFPRRRIQWI